MGNEDELLAYGDEVFPDDEDFTSTDGAEEDVIDEPEDDGSVAESDEGDTGEAYDTTPEDLAFGEEVLEDEDDFTSSDGSEEDDLSEAAVLDSVVEVEPEPVVTSEMTLPCIASVKAGDSVVIALVNGEPTVIGAAGYGDAVDSSITTVTADVAELGIVVAGKASIEELSATQANVDLLAADVAKIDVAKIEDLQANALTADSAVIKTLQADIAKVDTAAIDELKASKADIDLANVNNAWIQNGAIVDGSIGTAAIHDGAINTAKIADASITAAKIDSISADSITTGTLKTERLILVDEAGNEGIVTKINQLDGVLDGAAIVDDSISAAKVDVADLSAFEATIGGFDIDSSSIHSKKPSIADGTPGVFVGTTGIGLGDGSCTSDGSSPLQVFADGTFKLHGKNGSVIFNPVTGNIEVDATSLNIRSDEITFGSKILSNTVQETAEAASNLASGAMEQADSLDESVAGIVSNINNLTGDLYGAEGEDGRLTEIQNSIASQVSELEQSTSSSLGSLGKRVDSLEGSVAEVAPLSAYVRIATAADGTKYILIGNSSSPFQTKFTNEEIQFLNGDVKVAYVSHDTLEIMNANIHESLTFGDWRWKEEANGNLTLRFIG